jgi:RNA polymerase sigma factor (sigma-70 family)
VNTHTQRERFAGAGDRGRDTELDDQSARNACFARHHSDLLRYFERHGVEADAVEDLAQDTLLRLLVASSARKPQIRSPQAWLSCVARHALADHFRVRRVRRDKYRECALDNLPARSEYDPVERNELRRAIAEAERRLPSGLERAFRLRVYRHRTCADKGLTAAQAITFVARNEINVGVAKGDKKGGSPQIKVAAQVEPGETEFEVKIITQAMLRLVGDRGKKRRGGGRGGGAGAWGGKSPGEVRHRKIKLKPGEGLQVDSRKNNVKLFTRDQKGKKQKKTAPGGRNIPAGWKPGMGRRGKPVPPDKKPDPDEWPPLPNCIWPPTWTRPTDGYSIRRGDTRDGAIIYESEEFAAQYANSILGEPAAPDWLMELRAGQAEASGVYGMEDDLDVWHVREEAEPAVSLVFADQRPLDVFARYGVDQEALYESDQSPQREPSDESLSSEARSGSSDAPDEIQQPAERTAGTGEPETRSVSSWPVARTVPGSTLATVLGRTFPSDSNFGPLALPPGLGAKSGPD